MTQRLRIGNTKPTRRRILGLFAATTVAGLAASLRLGSDAPSGSVPEFLRWRGQALGADATLNIHHADPIEARRLLQLALAEVDRLEGVFSLHRPESALARLNREGFLENPPAELVELLGKAQQVSLATNGAFDVTVQPLWSLYQRHFTQRNADPSGPVQSDISAARNLVDYRQLRVSNSRISFGNPGMALTLNGIAQGEITDRVTDLLAYEGLTQSLIDLGEMRAIGHHPSGRPWRVGIKHPDDADRVIWKGHLTNRALATSAATGTVFDANGRHHHILDPANGAPSRGLISASVVAGRAATADALSTALLAAERPIAMKVLANLGAEKIITTDRDGETRQWTRA